MTIYARKTTGLLAGLVTAAMVAGCASAPNVYSNADPEADFSKYRTYGYFDSLSTDKDNYASLESAFLKVAVAQEMDARGYAYTADPDLLVNFYINTEEKIRSRQVPTVDGYFGYRDF